MHADFFPREAPTAGSLENTSSARFRLFAHTSTAPRFEAFVRGRCPRRERSRTINACAVAHWSRQSLSRLPGRGTHARGSSARSAPPDSLRERVLPCERLPMFEPCLQGRELCHSCDLCGDLPILGVRRSCDVCDDFGACRKRRPRLGTSSRVDRGSADLAPDEPRVKSERRSMPPHARGRERAILTRFRLVAFTSCPFQTCRPRKWRDSGGRVSRSCVSASKTKTRKRLCSSDLEHAPSSSNTLIHHAHAYIETRITHALPTQTSARIATAHPTLCALEVRRTPGRTRPTTRRRRTRRRRTTARPFIPANSAP